MPVIQTIDFKLGAYLYTARLTTHIYKDTVLLNELVVSNICNSHVHIDIKNIGGMPAYGILYPLDSKVGCGPSGTVNKEEEFIHILRASIKITNRIFPTVNIFIYNDANRRDCVASSEKIIPRGRDKPFSLPYLSLSYYGKTWFERKFNAKMMPDLCCNITREILNRLGCDEENIRYATYRGSVDALYHEKDIPLTSFIFYDMDQLIRLMQLYKTHRTWSDFFHAISKDDMYDALFNWLPPAIDAIVSKYDERDWYIDVRSMP
jgi:hypothetical protein